MIELEMRKFVFKLNNKQIKIYIELNEHENQHYHNTRNKSNLATLQSQTNRLLKGVNERSNPKFQCASGWHRKLWKYRPDKLNKELCKTGIRGSKR